MVYNSKLTEIRNDFQINIANIYHTTNCQKYVSLLFRFTHLTLLFIYHEITNFLTAEKGLTLTGEGTIDNTSEDNSDLGNGYQKSLIHVMGGECVIDGVTLINDPEYHWHGNSSTGHPYR